MLTQVLQTADSEKVYYYFTQTIVTPQRLRGALLTTVALMDYVNPECLLVCEIFIEGFKLLQWLALLSKEALRHTYYIY